MNPSRYIAVGNSYCDPRGWPSHLNGLGQVISHGGASVYDWIQGGQYHGDWVRAVQSAQPRVILAAAGNDILNALKAGQPRKIKAAQLALGLLISELRDQHKQVYAFTYSGWALWGIVPWWQAWYAAAKVNSYLRDVHAAAGAKELPLAKWTGPRDYERKTIHLNARGHKRVAQRMDKELP